MGGASGIEFFSLLFTAGVAAGAILAGSQNWLICAVILPLSALPCFFPEQIKNAGRRTSELVFSVTFILLGLFCALSSTLIPEDTPGALELLAGNSAERLRDLIGRIPFQSPDSEALIKALITGDRNGLTRGSVRVFRESGASHILALSGLHVGIIYLAADRIIRFSLGRAPWTRGIRFVLIVGAGAWFTLMTGAGPSIVRAFLFIAISEIMRLTCRPAKASRVLCLALLIQLVLDPAAITSVGFQLSYLAMAGIILVYPHIEKWYPQSSSPLRKIWQSAALSISCQLFTGPLVWIRFHSFPKYFLLTNLIALPLTTALMTAAIITIALSGLGICPLFMVKITEHLCHGLTEVLTIISGM